MTPTQQLDDIQVQDILPYIDNRSRQRLMHLRAALACNLAEAVQDPHALEVLRLYAKNFVVDVEVQLNQLKGKQDEKESRKFYPIACVAATRERPVSPRWLQPSRSGSSVLSGQRLEKPCCS